MAIPTGTWKFYAIPKGGWAIPSHIMLYERLIIIFIAVLLFIPILSVSWIANQKRKALETLAVREQELEIAHSRAEHLALHDPLTDLPNRRNLEIFISELDSSNSTKIGSVTAFAIDLDRFKEVNDKLGHDAGDAVLIHLAKILKKHVPSNGLVARTGGDEFIILSQACENQQIVDEVCHSIVTDLGKPFYYKDQDSRVGASIGVAISDPNTVSIEQLLKQADLALYDVKNSGRNNHKLFNRS